MVGATAWYAKPWKAFERFDSSPPTTVWRTKP